MKNPLLMTIIVAVVIGAVAFFAGMQYQKSQQTPAGQFATRPGQNGQSANRRFGQNGMIRPVRGEIISADASSITVKMSDGSTKLVLLGASATITQASPATVQDLQTGKQVLVFGNQNPDGSITAQNVQINPQANPSRLPQPSQPSQY